MLLNAHSILNNNLINMNKTLYVGLFASFLVAAGFGAFGLATAEEPDFQTGIYISEINWAGSAASGSDEWIEITNRSGESVDFSGWMLDNAATTGQTLLIEDETVVEDGTTLLIANYKNTNEKSSLMIEPDLVTSSLALTNSNLTVTLRDANGAIVDEAELGTGTPDFGGSDPFASAIRTTDDWVTADESVNLPEGQLGTPGEIDMVAEAIEEDGETVVSCPTLEQLLAEQEAEIEDGVQISGEESEDTDEVQVNDETESDEDSSDEDDVVCTCVKNSQSSEEVDSEEEAEASDSDTDDSEEIEVSNENDIDESDEELENTGIEDSDDSELSVNLSSVRINEVVSNPENGEEWVEFYNAGNETVSLDDAYLIDAAGKKTVLSGEIEASQYFLISSPKGQLNNDGDLVELRDSDDEVISSFTYGNDIPAPDKGESLAYSAGKYKLTTTITPNEENIITYAVDSDTDSQDVATSQSEEDSSDSEEDGEELSETATTETESLSDDGQNVENGVNAVTSVVTTPPGVLGKQIMYVDGYQVYMHSAEWPELELGDSVKLSGETYEARGEMRLKLGSADDIEVLNSGLVEAAELDEIEQNNWEHGSFVHAEGLITNRESDRFTLVFGENSAEVVLSAQTDLKMSSLISDYADVQGVLRLIDGSWKIYPFESNHLQSIESLNIDADSALSTTETVAEESTENKENAVELPIAGIGLFTGSVGALGYWFTKSLIT